ncbi:MAG: TlpA family protein disulfide reductase [Pyrinomonadaceae bacterium]
MRALALLLILAAPRATTTQPRQAPALALKDLRGRAVRLSDYRGKIVLLNFWATWCAPCRAEVPDLVKLQRDYGAQGLQVVGVTYPPESRAAVRRFARRYKINYPVCVGTRASKARFVESETLPFTVVIDRAGRVRELIEGVLLPDEFEEKIRPLLIESAAGDVPPRAGRIAPGSFSRREVVR